MTYNFSINQIKAIEWGLSPQEAIVFDFLFNVPSWAERVTLDGVDFFFIHRTKAIQECPIITDKEDTMYRHFKAIDKKGGIIYKKIDGRDCISLTKKGKTWRKANENGHFRHSEKNPDELGKKSESNSENFPTDNNTSIDNTNQGLKFNSSELPILKPKEKNNDKSKLFEAQKKGEPKAVPGKKAKTKTRKKKWDSEAQKRGRELFDINSRKWQKKCGIDVNDGEGLYWDGKAIGQLNNFMNRLRWKAGTSCSHFATDMDFVNQAMAPFLDAASNLVEAWYMDKFTPVNFVSNFESLYVDVKRNIRTGYVGGRKGSEQKQSKNNAASREALKMLRDEGAY